MAQFSSSAAAAGSSILLAGSRPMLCSRLTPPHALRSSSDKSSSRCVMTDWPRLPSTLPGSRRHCRALSWPKAVLAPTPCPDCLCGAPLLYPRAHRQACLRP
eukprot:5267351-Prymnesium_polylepis.1